MTAVTERTGHVTLIPRWLDHGDLTLLVHDGAVYARADQLEHLAHLTPWASGETLLDTTWPLELNGHAYYHLEDAIARCEADGSTHATDFLTWLRATLPELINDDVLDQAQYIPGFIGSHPVRVAARILSDDPTISIGRTALFAHMHHHGWIDRTNDHWTITTRARRNGWLTIRDVILPTVATARRTYPQIYITPAGLTELRRTLGALHPTPADTPPAITLFD